jgi:hypothetical protein
MKNWKTTLTGVSSIIGGIALFVNQPDKIQEAIGMVIIGIGFLSAKDHNVSGIQNLGGSNPPPKKDEK